MDELDELVDLIDRYEARFRVTSLSLVVLMLDDANEARLARLLHRARLRGRLTPHHILQRYGEPVCVVS